MGAGDRLHIGNGPMDIKPRASILGTAGSTNTRPMRSNKLNRKHKKGDGITLPKIPVRKGGKG